MSNEQSETSEQSGGVRGRGPSAAAVRACVGLSVAGLGPQGLSLLHARGSGAVNLSFWCGFTVTDCPVAAGHWEVPSAGEINAVAIRGWIYCAPAETIRVRKVTIEC